LGGYPQIMKSKSSLTVAFVLIIAACSQEQSTKSANTANGFDVLCSEFSSLTKEADYPSLSSEKRGEKLDGILAQQFEPNNNAYLAWSAIRNASPTERYTLYREAAASTGYRDWECPAIARHGHEVGSSFE
jgi:hypothetical protein